MEIVKMGVEEEQTQTQTKTQTQTQTQRKRLVEYEFLPFDSVYEILTRAPLDDLHCQCQWVCKDWQKLIYDTNFKLVHSQRTQTISGYFIQSQVFDEYHTSIVSIVGNSSYNIPSPSLDFLPKNNSKVVASSPQGLLCCVNQSDTQVQDFYICKPMTRQWIHIPNPKTRYTTERMAMMVKQSYPTLHYKILRISSSKAKPWYPHCEIFDSKNRAWKRSEDINLPHDVFLDPVKHCILVNGGFHWPTSDGRIFVYYIDEENWSIIDLPCELREMNEDESVHNKLVDYEGKIALLYIINECKLELWVLEDHSNHIWEKKFSRNMGSTHRIIGCNNLCGMFSNDIVVMKYFDDQLILYNWNKDTYSTAKPPGISSISEVFPFQSDLVPCRFK
ncbi:F-box associated domain [Macleaya cordata]|uniref:F-box associated domain n=1 Tax=Macleaya cordata TaxID=56857 RepID=A0A200PNC0_MACCD|nr:F-box associated domain [Macleaya cordata]